MTPRALVLALVFLAFAPSPTAWEASDVSPHLDDPHEAYVIGSEATS